MSNHPGSTLAVALLAGALLLPACASYRVIRPSDDPTADGPHRETINAFFWGSTYEPVAVATQCRYGINDLTIRRNLLQDLVSVITLGIWMPLEVEYTCVEPQPDTGDIPFDPDLYDDAGAHRDDNEEHRDDVDVAGR